ncbi:MAG: hypothetical protein KGP01_05485 [Actinomycetales bacterium]|nr:hypothetical protein [Actinomycetales bacterium]
MAGQTCPSGKRQYADRSAANRALASIAAQREQDLRQTGMTTRLENRSYRCHLCPWLHLTSTAEMWFAVEVDADLWQAALAEAAQERLVAAVTSLDATADELVTATAPSTSQDDWAVAA